MLALLFPAGAAMAQRPAQAQQLRKPVLEALYFNLYTDSIKPVLNFYVNVEGRYSDGSYLPLDTASIILSCDAGRMQGSEWVPPRIITFEKVTFTAVARHNPALRDEVTIYIRKARDPRDAPDYEE